MSVISNLSALTLTSSEQTTVAGVSPFEDASGTLTRILDDLIKLKTDLTYLNANMPAGANKTAIATVITNLA